MCHAVTGKQFTTVTARRIRRFGRDVPRCDSLAHRDHFLCRIYALDLRAGPTRWTYALDLRVVTPSSSSEPLTGCACRKRVTCYAEEVPVGEGLDPPPAYGRRKDGRHGRDV